MGLRRRKGNRTGSFDVTELNSPRSLSMTKDGLILVTCAQDVVTLNLETKHSSLLAGSSHSFGRLGGAACDGGLFYFADTLNHRIYVYDLTSAEISLIAVRTFKNRAQGNQATEMDQLLTLSSILLRN